MKTNINFKIGGKTLTIQELYGQEPNTTIVGFDLPRVGDYLTFDMFDPKYKQYMKKIFQVTAVHCKNYFQLNDFVIPTQGDIEKTYTIMLTKVNKNLNSL